MKNYVVKNIRGELKVISPRGFVPSDVLCECPPEYDFGQDHPDCLIVDESSGTPVASVDIIKQGELRAAKAQRELDRAKAKPMADLRARRNALLAESDYTQYRDADLTTAQKAEWKKYRKALKDLPETVEDASNPQWPQKPE